MTVYSAFGLVLMCLVIWAGIVIGMSFTFTALISVGRLMYHSFHFDEYIHDPMCFTIGLSCLYLVLVQSGVIDGGAVRLVVEEEGGGKKALAKAVPKTKCLY